MFDNKDTATEFFNTLTAVTIGSNSPLNLNKPKEFHFWTFLLNAAQTILSPHLFTGRRHSLDSIPNGIHFHHANTKSTSSARSRIDAFVFAPPLHC